MRLILAIALVFVMSGDLHARGGCGTSTSPNSLSMQARSLWYRIKATFPDAEIVSAYRCGARIAGTGHVSYHASGNAIDWTTRNYRAGIAWSRANASGLTMTYGGMSHIHSDVGRYHTYAHAGGKKSYSRRAYASKYQRHARRGYASHSAVRRVPPQKSFWDIFRTKRTFTRRYR